MHVVEFHFLTLLFGFFWGVHFFDTVFSVFLRVDRPREVSHLLFSLNFPSNAVRIMSGDRFLSRVMTMFIKTHFYKRRRTHRRAVVAVLVAVAVAAVVVAVVAAVAVVTAAAPTPTSPRAAAVTTATAATTATTAATTTAIITATTARLCVRLRL